MVHRQSPPATAGRAGGLVHTPSLQLLQYEGYNPLCSSSPFPCRISPSAWRAEGARHPKGLPRNSPCRRRDAGNSSMVFCQPGRVRFIKMHFPFHMYFSLKQTNAGRCHYSCSCALDTSQLKYLFLTLSPTSQKQAWKYKMREQSSSQKLPLFVVLTRKHKQKG